MVSFHLKIGCARGEFDVCLSPVLTDRLSITAVVISIGHVEILVICVICRNSRKPKSEQVCLEEEEKIRPTDQLNFEGAGGGYNERDNVEYNERRNDSDGEYDEVGSQ